MSIKLRAEYKVTMKTTQCNYARGECEKIRNVKYTT